MNSILLVVLGSVLALATSFVVEWFKDEKVTRSKRKNFKISLRLELKSAIDTINKLVENYGAKRFFEFTVLGELNPKIQRLDKIRDQIIYIQNNNKKELILNLLNDINLFYSDTFGLESNAFRAPTPGTTEQGTAIPWDSEMYKSQRQMLALRSVDLKRRVQDLITFLEE